MVPRPCPIRAPTLAEERPKGYSWKSGARNSVVRVPSSHGGSRRFESCRAQFAVRQRLAQLRTPRPPGGFLFFAASKCCDSQGDPDAVVASGSQRQAAAPYALRPQPIFRGSRGRIRFPSRLLNLPTAGEHASERPASPACSPTAVEALLTIATDHGGGRAWHAAVGRCSSLTLTPVCSWT